MKKIIMEKRKLIIPRTKNMQAHLAKPQRQHKAKFSLSLVHFLKRKKKHI